MTTTTDFKCAVRADLFARAMLAISTEQTRYYLNGVFITAAPEGGALLVATDGYWLVAIRDPRGIVDGSGIVALNDSMKKALAKHRTDYGRSIYGRGAERVLIVGAGETIKDARAMIVLGGPAETPKDAAPVDPRADTMTNLDEPGRDVVQAQFYDVLIDGTFPDFHRVIPSESDFTLRPPPDRQPPDRESLSGPSGWDYQVKSRYPRPFKRQPCERSCHGSTRLQADLRSHCHRRCHADAE